MDTPQFWRKKNMEREKPRTGEKETWEKLRPTSKRWQTLRLWYVSLPTEQEDKRSKYNSSHENNLERF